MALWPAGFAHAWQAIPCVENHDIVKVGEKPRVPALADGSNTRSWYARSRTRVAMGLLLTAPGIPQLFMGQEFLEDKQWCPDPRTTGPFDLVGRAGGVRDGKAVDPAMGDHLRFTQDAVRLRSSQPGLRGEGLNAFYAQDADRVIAFQRWVAGVGQDVRGGGDVERVDVVGISGRVSERGAVGRGVQQRCVRQLGEPDGGGECGWR